MKIYFFGKQTEVNAEERILLKRINFRTKCDLISLNQAGLTDGEKAKEIESKNFLKKIKDSDFLITFDERGKKMDSFQFAESLKNFKEDGKNIIFVMGGAYGLHHNILERANLSISLGDMVWTRNLARHMILEQIYRAGEISGGGNFHK